MILAIGVSIFFAAAASVTAAADDEAKWHDNLVSGHAAFEAGNYLRAHEYYAAAMTYAAAVPDQSRRALAESAMGGLEILTGNHALAATLLTHAREVWETLGRRESTEYGQTLAEIGSLRMNEGHWQEAEDLMKQAIGIFAGPGSKDSQRAASVESHLAFLYVAQARFNEARPLIEHAIAVQRRGTLATRVELIYSLRAEGTLWFSQNRFAEATGPLEEAWRFCQDLPGDHIATADTATHLGALYYAERQLNRAEPLLKKAVYIYEKSVGADSASLGPALTTLARIDESAKRFALAEQKFQRVLSILDKAYPARHVVIGFAQVNLGQLYNDEKKFEQARPLLESGLAIIRETFPEAHPSLATTLFEAARMRAGLRDWPGADAYFRESIEGYEKTAGPKNTRLAEMMRTYAAFLKSVRRRQEAKSFEARSRQILSFRQE